MLFVPVNTKPNYEIVISENNLLDNLLKSLQKYNRYKVAVITDSFLLKEYASFFSHLKNTINFSKIISFPYGEINKNRANKAQIEDKLFQLGYLRDTVVIAIGGGVVTDLAGFIAATFCRGVPFIACPTTLLAMVDASVGGKTAINTEFGKNLIGTFYQPSAVFIDINFLHSLSHLEFCQGLAEMLKHSLLFSEEEFFAILNNGYSWLKNRNITAHRIGLHCSFKAKIVAVDPKENSIRKVLNFGHTIAHAIEKISAYNIPHGIAVLLGIALELEIAVLQKRTNINPSLIWQWLTKLSIPWQQYNLSFGEDVLLNAMQSDKKNYSDEIAYIVLPEIGYYAQIKKQVLLGQIKAGILSLALEKLKNL